VAELGNLTGRILLSLCRMSTVKIRAGSLFCTPLSRNGAGEAGFRLRNAGLHTDMCRWPMVSEQAPVIACRQDKLFS
jgi:hypothetical protein